MQKSMNIIVDDAGILAKINPCACNGSRTYQNLLSSITEKQVIARHAINLDSVDIHPLYSQKEEYNLLIRTSRLRITKMLKKHTKNVAKMRVS